MNLNNFSREQLTEMLALFKELKSQQRDRRSEMQELPSEIFSDMEDVATKSLKANLQKLAKEAIAYDGGRWTQIYARYKDADRLRTTGRAATELYEDVKFIVEREGSEGNAVLMEQIMENTRRFAIYGFASGKHIDQEAKDIVVKSLNIPG
ncbi:hypothetical protein DFQ28_010655 [Apophysomyces sp. BC1034]|nr:hypothetical protein DFQ30_003569 [Apophysomyces sp. BC1015]KAG0184723.1 hypothetical protein DFQ28_010655 [Apophysomyces sp. BC1034]